MCTAEYLTSDFDVNAISFTAYMSVMVNFREDGSLTNKPYYAIYADDVMIWGFSKLKTSYNSKMESMEVVVSIPANAKYLKFEGSNIFEYSGTFGYDQTL